MSDPKEVELKLVCDAGDLAMLRGCPRFAADAAAGKGRLESVYFDTPEGLLRDAGYVLRVRRAHGAYIQTVKAGGDGLIERPEWEEPVGGPEPDRDALRRTPLAKRLGKKAKLRAVFTVSVDRTIWLVKQGDTQIEVALDQGCITSPDAKHGSDPICEIELELKVGRAGDLFTLAHEIGECLPVRVGVASKAERGFALTDGKVDQAHKAEPIDLSDDLSAAEAFRAIAHGCLRHLRRNEDVLLVRPDGDALHQTRVAIRRLRSAISLFGDLLKDDRLGSIKAELKRLSEPLGRARNLDVFLLETLPRERARHPDQAEYLELEAYLEGRRAEAYEALHRMLRSQEWRSLLVDLVAWINAGPWLSAGAGTGSDEPVLRFASRVLDKRRRQVKKPGRLLATLSQEERHQVRIAAKKLRYGAEFFAGLYDRKKERKSRKAFAAALSKLQDSLGALNDIAVGHDLLEQMAGAHADGSPLFAAGLMTADIRANERELLASAVAAHEELVELWPFWR